MKSPKLRRSAAGQPCTFEIPGVCNYDPATTVLCHLQFDGGIMGGKASDISAAYGCSACHEAIDQRKHAMQSVDRWFYMGRALSRTLQIMLKEGTIKL